jgi:predicted nucleotidyltransferase
MPTAPASIPTDLRPTLRWVTETLRQIYGPRLRRLILFGSQARGEAIPDSDMDVLVVLNSPIRAYEERSAPVGWHSGRRPIGTRSSRSSI